MSPILRVLPHIRPDSKPGGRPHPTPPTGRPPGGENEDAGKCFHGRFCGFNSGSAQLLTDRSQSKSGLGLTKTPVRRKPALLLLPPAESCVCGLSRARLPSKCTSTEQLSQQALGLSSQKNAGAAHSFNLCIIATYCAIRSTFLPPKK